MTDAIYLRISKDRKGLELGVDRQDNDCAPLARPGYLRFVDNDTSASTGRAREDYDRLMAAVVAGTVTRIIVWSLGRLWRNRRERAEAFEILRTARVQVVPVKGPALDFSTAAGRALAGLIGEFDTWETDVMSERIEREVQQRAEAGKPHGGPRAYGYTADGMELVPDEAERVARWFAEFLAGRSLSSIGKEAGKTHATVRWILRNPRYAGLRVHGGREHEALWPRLVEPEVWRATKELLEDPDRRKNTANVAKRWIGSGLYGCLRCDARPVASGWTTQRKRIYKCAPQTGGCSRSWRADRLDEAIVGAIAGRLRQADLANLLPRDRPDVDALRAERKALRSRLDTLASSWALGTLTDDQLALANTKVRERLVDVEAELVEAGNADPVLELLAHDDPAGEWLAIPEDQVGRRQRIVRGLATVVLGASPPGRAQWTPALVLGESRWVGDAKTWAELYIQGRDTP